MRHGGGLSRLRLVSVNTWIIVINVAVFLVGNVMLGNRLAEFTAGRVQYAGVSPERIRQGAVDRSVRAQMPGGYFGHPIIDRQTREIIGHERLTYRPIVEGYGHFSTGKALELQVWRFLTFQFLHASLTHLVFNMLGLWFVGSLVEQYLGSRRYLAFYLLCGIAGAVVYLILNAIGYGVQIGAPSLMPRSFGLLFNDTYTPLVGASAGVFGVLMGAAFIAPSEIVYVLNIFPMKMRTAVYSFLGLATLNLVFGGSNAGGDAAHVGGAIAGYVFIRRTHLLRDFFQLVGGPPRKAGGGRRSSRARADESRVDAILDKVRAEGLASLSEGEKAELRRASRRDDGSRA